MLKDIFEGTPQHKYYLDLARDQVEQEHQKELQVLLQTHLQAERELLLMIVQIRFPTLIRLAKTQAWLIKDVTTIKEVAGRVSKAQNTEEATNALVSWLPGDDVQE